MKISTVLRKWTLIAINLHFWKKKKDIKKLFTKKPLQESQNVSHRSCAEPSNEKGNISCEVHWQNQCIIAELKKILLVSPWQIGLIFTDLSSRRSNSNTCSLQNYYQLIIN